MHIRCVHSDRASALPPSLHVQPTPTCWSCACSFRITAAARWRRRWSGTPLASPRRWRARVERIQPSRQASSPNAHPTTLAHTPTPTRTRTPTRTLTPTPQPRAQAQPQPQAQPCSGGARHLRAVHRRRGALPRARRDPPRHQAHQHLLRRAQRQRRHCKRQPRRGALGVRVRVRVS